jgi:catechol 2,3-dioxygenase-like lactoylglutathione lyase family enzyme
MTLKRMDNVLIVVDDLEAVKAFFIELGLKLEGETTVDGPSVGSLIGLKDVRATLAMMRTPDGQGIELDKFHTPDANQVWAGGRADEHAGHPSRHVHRR